MAARALDEGAINYQRSLIRAGVWIYGAGGYGRKVQKLLHENGFDFRGFIDSRAASNQLPTEICAPVRARDDFNGAQNTGLIIGIHNFSDNLTEIVNWARAVGFDPILTPGDLPDILGPGSDSYWLTSRRHTVAHVEDIIALARNVADVQSIEVIRGLAMLRLTGDIHQQPPPDRANQYLPKDLQPPRQPICFVDGGAYDGDTFRALSAASLQVSDWIAFEPDLANFSKLSITARAAAATRARLFPCGLGRTTEDLFFSDGEGAGSHITASSDTSSQIRVVSLDEVAPGLNPTFVKLDVEGSEAHALLGMRRILIASRPYCAVSVYHKPSDLWELPALIREIIPEADFYIRQHGYNGFDTVLYVIPR